MAVKALAVTIVELRPEHWPDVARIYADGIATGTPPSKPRCPAGMSGTARIWPSTVSSRCVTARSSAGSPSVRFPTAVSTAAWSRTVDVDQQFRGQGVGRLLLERLIASTERAGIWTIQTGSFPENETSLRLHERVGFEIVGRRKRLGKLLGVWRDVLLLERRSDTVE